MLYANEALWMIGIYLVGMIAVGYYLAKRESAQDFIISNRDVGIIPTAGSLAASFRDGGGIAIWITMGLAASYGPMWLLVGVGLAAVVLSIIGPKLRDQAARDGHITIAERVAGKIGPASTILSALVTMVFGLFLIALQFHVAGGVFANIIGWPAAAGVAIIAIILVFYLVAGGYKSVIITDTIQFFLIFSLIVIPFFLPPTWVDVANIASFTDFGLNDKLAFLLFGFFVLLVMPECWQRIYSARDARVIRYSLPLMTVMLIIMTLSLIWLGMGLRITMPDIDRAQPYLDLFNHPGLMPGWLMGYIAMVFLAITMSTQSAATYAFVATVNKVFLPSHSDTDAKYIRMSRLLMIVLLIGAAVISLTVSDAMKFVLDIIAFINCLAPLYMIAALNLLPNGEAPAIRKRHDWVIAIVTAIGCAMFTYIVLNKLNAESFLLSSLPSLLVTAVLAAYVWFIRLRQAA
jgi:solute:Na+ symporter, SSS family